MKIIAITYTDELVSRSNLEVIRIKRQFKLLQCVIFLNFSFKAKNKTNEL